jgi:hypothetical protein
MKTTEKAYMYVIAIVGLSVLAIDPEPGTGSNFGWVLYGVLMTLLVSGLFRLIAEISSPHAGRVTVRNSRSHHEVKR